MDTLTRSTKKMDAIKVMQTTRIQRMRVGTAESIRRISTARDELLKKLDSIPWFGRDGNRESRAAHWRVENRLPDGKLCATGSSSRCIEHISPEKHIAKGE